ncbi:MAG: DUF1572 family protein [Myroides sp.]
MESTFIESVKKQFAYYKHLGDKTFEQLQEPDFFWQFNPESNSIAVIVKHLWGNMLSRWTDIFTTDGEKEWRNRDSEFEADLNSATEVLEKWEVGWNCLFNTLNSLSESDLNKIIYIRNEGHTVQEAINRQLAHYPYHVGQIVFIGKMIQNEKWQSLSIPRNKSNQYNAEKFSAEKQRRHFTDDLLNDKNKE